MSIWLPNSSALTCQVTATPDSLPYGGGTVHLRWSSSNADTLIFVPYFGPTGLSGEADIRIYGTTKIILTAINRNHSTSDTAVTYVGEKVPPTTGDFTYPLGIGYAWTYRHTYLYSYAPHGMAGDYRTTNGIEAWQIVGLGVVVDSLSYKVRCVRMDTMQSSGSHWIMRDTVYFSILAAPNYFHPKFGPLVEYPPGESSPDYYVPRYPEPMTDDVHIGFAHFYNRIGLTYYGWSINSIATTAYESYTLISYSFQP